MSKTMSPNDVPPKVRERLLNKAARGLYKACLGHRSGHEIERHCRYSGPHIKSRVVPTVQLEVRCPGWNLFLSMARKGGLKENKKWESESR